MISPLYGTSSRDGAIVWQGTAEQLLAWIDAGEIKGARRLGRRVRRLASCQHVGADGLDSRCQIALHDDMTGELTGLQPEGTAALRICSSLTGRQPSRQVAKTKRQRAQRARPSVSIGLIIGIGIGVAVAATWSLWQGSAPALSALGSAQAHQRTTQLRG